MEKNLIKQKPSKIDMRNATKKDLVDIAKLIIRLRKSLKKSGKKVVVKKVSKS